MERIRKIRAAEAASHTEAYEHHDLYEAGSWLAKPVRTVMDLLPLFDGYTEFRALDLGSGVGRNSIPAAQRFKDIPCRVDCVDILELAIGKLRENARRFGVENAISGIVSAIDDYEIEGESYDLILAVSALEHVASRAVFEKKLVETRNGLRSGGVACLIVNSGVTERDKATDRELPPQFEVNLPTDEMERIMARTFPDWQIIRHTVARQKYDIPRAGGLAELETDVVTWVVRRPGAHNARISGAQAL